MKVLITGAKGMLGKAVKERFKDEEVICTDIEELDITNYDSVMEYVTSKKPDIIINCAAFTDVDGAEGQENIAYKVNCTGPENLAKASSESGSLLVHISTDYVFGGDLSIDKIYLETDLKNPHTVYGLTKLEGEKAIKKFTTRYLIFRTAWLFGDGKNFVRTMLKLGKEKDKVHVIYDQHGSPTYTVDLANVIYQAIKKKIPLGIYNVTNLGFTTWFDFTKEIFTKAGISCDIVPVMSSEFESLAERPKNSMMAKGKILEEGIEIPSWQDALGRYLEEELKNE